MVFGIVCICVSVVALILCPICGRAVNPVLALPMFFVFLISLIAGILAIVFDSAVPGIIAIVVIVLFLLNAFCP